MPQDTLDIAGTNEFWDVGANWSGGLPNSSSDAVIASSTGQFASVTIAGSDPAYTVNSLSITSPSAMAGPFLSDNGNLTVAGTTNITAGAIEVFNSGSLTLQGATTLGPGALISVAVGTGLVTIGAVTGQRGMFSNGEVVVSSGAASVVTALGTVSFILKGGSVTVGSTSGTDDFNLNGGKLALGVTGKILTDEVDPFATVPIDLTKIGYQPGETATVSPAASNGGIQTYQIVLTGLSGQTLFTFGNVFSGYDEIAPYSSIVPVVTGVAADGQGGTIVTVACYASDTAILTSTGDVPAGSLRVGNHVVTASGRVAPIVWIGRRSYAGRFLAGQRQLLPVRIRAGALAERVPRRDLLVSPCHAMLIDGALVPARDLVNGVSIVQEAVLDRIDYVHIELAQHDVILAEGAPSETFVDDGGRGAFHNVSEWHSADPGAADACAVYCAPRLTEGPALEAIRRRLAARVEPMRRLAA